MQCVQKALLIKGAVVVGMTGMLLLALFAFGVAFLDSGLGSLAESLRTLHRQREIAQRLEEWGRQIQETGQEMDRIVEELIQQQCDLHEAVVRYRAVCQPVDLRILENLYPQAGSEEERLLCHFFYLVGKRLEADPNMCADVLARLRQEKNAAAGGGRRGPVHVKTRSMFTNYE